MNKRLRILVITILICIMGLSLLAYNQKLENKQTIAIKEAKNKKKKEKKKKTNEIDFKTFQKYIKEEKVYTFAITNNNSNISLKFTELINTMSNNYSEKIYILKIDTLSKKEKAKYYNISKEFAELKEDYIIKTYNNKIIQITTFDKDNIDKIIKSYKKEN